MTTTSNVSEDLPLTSRWWMHDLSSFRGLRSLTLSEIGDELLAWRAQIVQVLAASPELRALDLSISGLAIYQVRGQDIYDPQFFDRMCDEYAEAGGMPLKLRSLRCGNAIYPMSHSSLAKLVSLECLQEVAICNRNVACGGWKASPPVYPSLYANARSRIAFGAFEPKHCPNLRRLAIRHFRLDVSEFLCTIAEDKAFSKKLALSIGGLGWSPGDPSILFKSNPEIPGLPIQLRAVGLEPGWRNRDWYDTKGIKADTVLDHLLTSNADSLEGIAIHLLCKGSREAASEFLQLPVLESVARRLPRLRQLAFNSSISTRDWLLEDRKMVVEAAQRLAAAGPKLVFIGMYRHFWRVNRRDDGRIELEELGREEWRSVEVFVHTSSDPSRFAPFWQKQHRDDWPNLL